MITLSMRSLAGATALMLATTCGAQTLSAQTLRVWGQLNPNSTADPRERVLKKLIGEFEAANPGVKIEVEPQVWQQLSDKFFAAHQTKTAPDVVWVYSPRVVEAVNMGALANLDELFVKNWSQADKDDVDGSFWRLGAKPNAHYQITHSASSAGTFYRVDLFKEAGIDPKSLSTWDKYIAAAQKLTVKDASGTVTRWGLGQAFAVDPAFKPIAFSVLLEKDKQAFDEKGRAVWATPAGVQGLALQTDLVRKHKVTPESAVSAKTDDLYDAFNAGRMAMIRGASVRIPRAMQALGADKVGYLKTPSFTEGKYSPIEIVGWSLGVWSGSPHKELAGKFVEFLSSKHADRLWVMEGASVPVRKSTIKENPQFFAEPKNAFLVEVAEEAVDYGWFAPEGLKFGWNEEIMRAAQDVITNNTDPKVAMEKAEAAFNRQVRR
jgi:multiple sugar transport system substrate-binding protein